MTTHIPPSAEELERWNELCTDKYCPAYRLKREISERLIAEIRRLRGKCYDWAGTVKSIYHHSEAEAAMELIAELRAESEGKANG